MNTRMGEIIFLALAVSFPSGTLALVPELPPGFPYLAGHCGIGLAVPAEPDVGLQCGGIVDNGEGFRCENVAGGVLCEFSFGGEAHVTRWLTGGSFHAQITGTCFAGADDAWGVGEALLPRSKTFQCSVTRYVPFGSCTQFQTVLAISFTGTFAPADYNDPAETGEFCA